MLHQDIPRSRQQPQELVGKSLSEPEGSAKKLSSGQVLELHRRIQEGSLPSLGLTENKNGSFVCRSSGTDHLRMGSRQAPGKTAKVMGFVFHTFFSLGVSWSDQSYFLRGPDGEGRVI